MIKRLKKAYIKYFKPDMLFGGRDEDFKCSFNSSTIYAEYGCGSSTTWVAKNIGCKIYCVDTSKDWIDRVVNQTKGLSNVMIHWIDLGMLGKWGRPESYEKIELFSNYTDWIWQNKEKPNVILVDGRFRVCCFLTSLLFADPGAKIIFDDYGRRRYHIVEKFLKPERFNGRQGIFIVPSSDKIDLIELKKYIMLFRCVFD
jgi:hypothetical protein